MSRSDLQMIFSETGDAHCRAIKTSVRKGYTSASLKP